MDRHWICPVCNKKATGGTFACISCRLWCHVKCCSMTMEEVKMADRSRLVCVKCKEGPTVDTNSDNLKNHNTDAVKMEKKMFKQNSSVISMKLKDLGKLSKQEEATVLCYIYEALKDCAQEIFEENVFKWMKALVQISNLMPAPNILGLCYDSLCFLLRRSITSNKISREIGLKGLETLLLLLTSSNSTVIKETFQLLIVCMKFYPGPCWKFRDSIQNLILSSIETPNETIRRSAINCFPLLSFCGCGGESGKRHSENWLLLFKRIIKTCYNKIQCLLEGLKDESHNDKKEKTNNIELIEFKTTPVNNGNLLDYLTLLSHQVENLILIIQVFISDKTPFKVEVPIPYVIQLFCYASDILDVKVQYSHINKDDIHLLYIPLIQAMCSCLSVCIFQFTTLLIPYHDVIMGMLVKYIYIDNLAKTCSYKLISDVLTTWRGMIKDTYYTEKFICFILEEIDISKLQSTGKISNIEEINNKNTKKQGSAVIRSSPESEFHISTRKEEKMYDGLQLLKTIIEICGVNLPVLLLNETISKVMFLLASIYGETNNIGAKFSLNICKILFEISFELMNLHKFGFPSVISIFLKFFVIGSEDDREVIASYCRNCLSKSDVMLHPINPVFRSSKYISTRVNGFDDSQNASTGFSQMSLEQAARSSFTQELRIQHKENLDNNETDLSNSAVDVSRNIPVKETISVQSNSITQTNIKPQKVSNRTCQSADTERRRSNKNQNEARCQSEPIVRYTSRNSYEKEKQDVSSEESQSENKEVVVVDSSGDDEDGEEEFRFKRKRQRVENEVNNQNNRINKEALNKRNKEESNSKRKLISAEQCIDIDNEVETILQTFCDEPASP